MRIHMDDAPLSGRAGFFFSLTAAAAAAAAAWNQGGISATQRGRSSKEIRGAQAQSGAIINVTVPV